jgi:hypothetical protein
MKRRTLNVMQTAVRCGVAMVGVFGLVALLIWGAIQARGAELPAVLYNAGTAAEWLASPLELKRETMRWHMGGWAARFPAGGMSVDVLVECVDELARRNRQAVIMAAINCTPPASVGSVR